MMELIVASIVLMSAPDSNNKEENVIELNCGNPNLWYSYHYKGRSVSSCRELLEMKQRDEEKRKYNKTLINYEDPNL